MAFGSAHLAVALVLFAWVAPLSVFAKGVLCSAHPLYTAGMSHQIIRSWSYASQNPDGRMHWENSIYHPQYTAQTWVPQGEPSSTKYVGLDFFTTNSGAIAQEEYVTLSFQRPAKLYLVLHARDSALPAATLAGWKSEGWVERREDNGERFTTFGLGQFKTQMPLPFTGVVFSKVGQDIAIPDRRFLAANVRGVTVPGTFSALIAEEDGTAVKTPASPAGMTVTPGARCPTALHDKWTAKGTDADDPQTRDMQFETWHPLWDPCYWCAYDHEHGSAAKELMGYTPRYGYTALKNKNQDESKKGFKDFVLDVSNYYVYLGLHGHMSKPGRFSARHHTLVMAVTDKATKTLQLELRFKADFGHLSTRLTNGDFGPLTEKDQKMREALIKKRKPRHLRLVNVIDMDNLDPKFNYRPAPAQLNGRYEQWFSSPMCTDTKRGSEPIWDFKTMGLAMKAIEGTATTQLGALRFGGKFVPHASAERRFRSRSFSIGDAHCTLKKQEPGAQKKTTVTGMNGKFYTNRYGKSLVDGPSPNAIAQYIAPGFSVTISGTFEILETWLGLYKAGANGDFINVGFAIDEGEN